jgi:hypothetical protein
MRVFLRPVLRAFVILAPVLGSAGATHAAPSLAGTAVAEFVSEGPRSGLWKYTIQYSYTSDIPTWALTLDLELGACPCACTARYEFDFPAGSAPGNGGACTSIFNGKFSCSGDPWVGLTTPVVDFWPATSTCRPHGSGQGQLVFYSELRPRIAPSTNAIYGRSGTTVWSGAITGQMPSCQGCTSTSVDEGTWGRIKATYR